MTGDIYIDDSYEALIGRGANSAEVERGGPGSGHHGHKGRPGERGGSLPGEGGEAEKGGKGGKPKPQIAGTVKGRPRASKSAGKRYFGTAPDEWRTGLKATWVGPRIKLWFDNNTSVSPQSAIGQALQVVAAATTPDELSSAVEQLENAMLESAQPRTPTRLRHIDEPEMQEAWKAVEDYRKWRFFNEPEKVRDAYGGYHPAETNRWAFKDGRTPEQAMDFQYAVGSAMLEIANISGYRLGGLSLRDHIPQDWVDELSARGKDPSGLRGGFDPRNLELVLPPEAYEQDWEWNHTILHELTHVVDDGAAGVDGYSPFGDGIYASSVLDVPPEYAERLSSASEAFYDRRSDVTGEFVADAIAGLHLNKTTGPRTRMGIDNGGSVEAALLHWLKAVRDGELEGLPMERGRELALAGHEKWKVEEAMTTDDGTRIFIRTLDERGGYEVLFKPDGPFIAPGITTRGGPGSGHFGHAGRPGQRGGSQPGTGGGGEKRYEVRKFLSYKGDTKESPRVRKMASEMFARSKASEPRLSALMQTVIAASGGKPFGWDFRIKSEDSIADKIIRDAVEKDIPPSKAAAEMNDLNRYTLLFDPDTFVEQASRAMTTLEQAGFEVYDSKAKNYFSPGDAYDGYNTVYWDPKTGEKFELQFHTDESARIKEEVHVIYNDWRQLPPDAPERPELWGKMLSMWGDYARPKNYQLLPGRLMTSGGGA